jgi:hypothetical protein
MAPPTVLAARPAPPLPSPAATSPAVSPPPPTGRDLTVDLLRGVAMVLVVVGHWLVVVPSYRDGRFGGINALETVPLMRGLTWIFQVMPLFFAIGGYAGAASWAAARARAADVARGPAYPAWLRTRLHRLLAPTLALLGGWAALCAGLRLAGLDAGLVRTLGGLVVVPVWFLAVYVVVTALVPVSVAAHRRFGLGAPVALAVVALGVDAMRIGAGAPGAWVAPLNFFAVYLFAQQLGLWWRDGRVRRPGRLALAGLAALWALSHVGPYPVSMVGVPGEALANNAPPTLCLVALALVQVGLAVRLRPGLERLLRHRPVQLVTLVLNRNAMTILLWHFTALAIGALVVLPLGMVPTAADGTPGWWALRLAAVVVLTPVLAALVAVVGRIERSPGAVPALDRGSAATVRLLIIPATVRLLVAVALLSAGFAVVAVRGLSEATTPLGLPLLALALVGSGTLLARR